MVTPTATTDSYPIVDLLANRARLTPDNIAFVLASGQGAITYQAFNDNINRCANLLAEHQIQSGDTVAILCHNCVEFFELLFACARVGAVLVPLNWRQTASELQPIVVESGAQLLFADANTTELAAQLRKDCPQINVLALDPDTATALQAPLYEQLRDYQEPTFTEATRQPGELWYLLYTSGTTGKPKAVMQTFGMALANYVNSNQAIELTPRDTTLNFLPLFHTAGINLYTLPMLFAGGTVILLPKFDEDRVCELINDGRISVFFGVPAIYRALSLHPRFPELELSAVRSWGCGGAPIQTEILEHFAKHNARICNGFGMTETGPMTFLMDPERALEKLGSIGKPQILTSVKIVDENGQEVQQGEAGQLLLKGANITPGYWNNPEATAQTFDAEGWLCSGDVARQDKDGYFFIVDRIKDMYISGGENVYPAEVQAVIEQHDTVLESAVIGIPDDRWGEVGCAFVIAKPGADVNLDQLAQHCKAHLATYKVPKRFVVCDDFPRTAAGKVQKNLLRKPA
jgi:fatty-acyl-CoA synthase